LVGFTDRSTGCCDENRKLVVLSVIQRRGIKREDKRERRNIKLGKPNCTISKMIKFGHHIQYPILANEMA
jgi:hypothetical protein